MSEGKTVKLHNKVAIVTGASRGIGKAIALALAREGAAVTLAARTEEPSRHIPGTIHTTAEEIRSFGGRVLPLRTDVIDEKQVAVMVQRTVEEFDKIDILVNNAATNRPAFFHQMSIKHWDAILKVNLSGPVVCTKAVLPIMMKQQAGHIINLSSVAAQRVGHDPLTGLAYDVSKAAINRFTLGLARELLRYGIAVNALAPDNTKTEGWSYLNPSVDNSNWMEPELWGRYAVLVASQDPASLTGKILSHEMLLKMGEPNQ